VYRVLVADDERLEREALQFMLQQLDEIVAGVSVAANGREAIEVAEVEPPDIAIIDIKMPGINGIEAARRIKELHPDCRVVFLTAFNYFDYAQEAIRLHADDFILKPASQKRLEAVIHELADRLDSERPRPAVPQPETDERDLAQSKLIGDAILGQVDEQILRRYVQLERDDDPVTTAIVVRVAADGGAFRHETPDHARILRRRVLSLLRHECASNDLRLLASAETSSLYALLVTSGHEVAASHATSAAPVHRGVVARFRLIAERELGVRLSIGIDGPANGFSRLGLRFANAKVADRLGGNVPDASPDRRGARAAGRAVLEVEQRIVRAILAGDRDAMEAMNTNLFASIREAASPGLLREELAEAMTYIAHATAMQIGRLPDDVAKLIRALSDAKAEPTERNLLLATASVCERLVHHAAQTLETMHAAVLEARSYIDEHYAEDLSLDQVALHVRLSPFHLSRIFKRATHSTVLNYLKRRRLDEAQRLLQEQRLSVKEVGAKVGYTDQNYFSRVFRGLTGMTPSAYRRAHQ
jgi:two-component system response regulator YesN